MHGLIRKLLEKRGVKSVDELDSKSLPDGSPSEKTVFETWNAILSKEELTTEDIKKFCETQISIIEDKWKDLNETNQKKAELIPYHTVYRMLLAAINSPRSARAALEIQLQQLLK